MRQRVQFGRNLKERMVEATLFLFALLSVGTTAAIVIILLSQAFSFFQEVSFIEFFTGTVWSPLLKPQHFGVLPLISGTLMVAFGASLVALPVGLASAIYLSEYAPDRTRRIIKPFLEVLAGIPTVVYGYFALTFVTPLIQRVHPETNFFNAFSASLVVGIMIIPMVASLSADAMLAVPNSLRDAAYGLGSTKLEVALKVVTPAAVSGIVASFVLAISRAIGETMIVSLAAGATPVLRFDYFDSIQTMTGYIVQVSLGDVQWGSIEHKTLFAVGTTLFFMTLIMNILAAWVARRFREVYR